VTGDWLTTVLATFAGLLPIVNPFSTAMVFLALTARMTETERQRQATLACCYATGVLWVFLFAGALIMSFFGISIPSLRVAGGLIVARVGFSMLAPPDDGEAPEGAAARAEIAFTPLAVPMLSGPGSIAVTIGMAAGSESVADYLAVALGIALVVLASWGVLRGARGVKRLLGEQGVDALTRIMGFLLVCIGVQFVGIGVMEVIHDPQFVAPIVEAIERARSG
jgi:multiple antibiotic resistance protein